MELKKIREIFPLTKILFMPHITSGASISIEIRIVSFIWNIISGKLVWGVRAQCGGERRCQRHGANSLGTMPAVDNPLAVYRPALPRSPLTRGILKCYL